MMLIADKKIPAGIGCPCCNAGSATLWMKAPAPGEDEARYSLLRCSACSHVWLADPPSPSELSYYYDPAYHQAVGNSGAHDPKRWGRQLAVISRYKTAGSILDIGCSSGGFLAFLKGRGWTLAGIEASEATAEKARLATGGRIFAGDVVNADFAENSFDVVTCSDVLEHLYDPRAVFNLVQKWLKPGGAFYLFVPNIRSWEARAFGSSWIGLDLPRHLHHYSVDSLRTLGDFAGLSLVRMVTPPGCYIESSLSIWLNSLLRRAGVRNPSIDLSGRLWFGWRVVRKVIRLTLESAYARAASLCRAAPSLQAVLQKPEEPVRPVISAADSAKSKLAQVPSDREEEAVTQ